MRRRPTDLVRERRIRLIVEAARTYRPRTLSELRATPTCRLWQLSTFDDSAQEAIDRGLLLDGPGPDDHLIVLDLDGGWLL
jgi:hypothetical protein